MRSEEAEAAEAEVLRLREIVASLRRELAAARQARDAWLELLLEERERSRGLQKVG